MSFDRNYQIRIQDRLTLPWVQPPRRGRVLYNQTINKLRFYSSKAAVQLSEKQNIILNSWWITGFVDGEGCFLILITEDQKSKTGWKVRLFFEIHLHEKDEALLDKIKNFFNTGEIFKIKEKSQAVIFIVSSKKELAVIIEFFEKFPLITEKRADYELWKKKLIIF